MDTAKLKTFAPRARHDLQEQVGAKLDYVLGADTAELRDQTLQVKKVRESVEREGREAYVDRIAYTWFNRLSALRFIDAKGYHPFGCRVITPEPGKVQPEILALALSGGLPGTLPVDLTRISDLLEGRIPSANPQSEVYRHLVLAVCAYYHDLLPFLFEEVGDEAALLLPDDLLTPASVAEGFRTEISDEDCSDVEIIGWLYQFYISEKKDEVIGKVVKSEDIPAATQLFTPNWIVKYMVQNSLGAQWLATYPQSPLKGQMEYYIEPAEQTAEVNAQLAAITPSQLNPEELTLIDPASGSGHILVEAYELFKAIYLERGYRQRDVPQLILEKNLFGLDIDERAAQLTGFALMMKGRADDRRLFDRGVKLNVMALVDSAGFDAEALAKGVELSDYGLKPGDLTELKNLFEHATTFGSLIQVPEGLAAKLPALKQLSEATSQDLFVSEALKRLGPLVQQAELLAAQYDAVVANPPYMGRRGGMNSLLKAYTEDCFPNAKGDLFACFVEQGFTLARDSGYNSMITMQSWMFLSSYEQMREDMLRNKSIRTMAHLGARAFATISGEVVQTTAFVLRNGGLPSYRPTFLRLLDGDEEEKRLGLANDMHRFDEIVQEELRKIPGSPLAYWVSDQVISIFANEGSLDSVADPRQGFATGDNDRFLRQWPEIPFSKTALTCGSLEALRETGKKWVPCNKGGHFRRWFGNNDLVVAFDEGNYAALGNQGNHLPSKSYYFRAGWTWSTISSKAGFRLSPSGHVFETKGSVCFPRNTSDMFVVGGYLNSKLVESFLGATSPTLDFHEGPLRRVPYKASLRLPDSSLAVGELIEFGKRDWDAYERSWDFQSLPLLTASSESTPTLESSYTAWITQNRDTIAEMKRLEEENNRLFIDAYGLADELTPDVPIEQITLTVNPAYRYGGKLTEEEQWTRFRQDTMEELVSYAIGCMMGRYSLDAPGLILADSRENPEAHMAAYSEKVGKPMDALKFEPDDDGIIPVLDDEWFEDDVVARFRVFLRAAFGDESLEENLRFLEEAIGKKIRKYFVANFYKAHLQAYKKRPIYWLFQSPKKSFQALVYLHRYDRDTANRLLNDYLRPYLDKLRNRQEQLTQTQVSESSSNSEKNRATKEKEKNANAIKELEDWERDVIFPLAAQRLEIDLDDGVKVNYAKFGKAVAKVAGLN